MIRKDSLVVCAAGLIHRYGNTRALEAVDLRIPSEGMAGFIDSSVRTVSANRACSA